MKFKTGVTYRHLCAKDLDIEVVRVQYADAKRAKLVVRYVYQKSKAICWVGSDGLDRVTVLADDFQYWKRVV